MATIYVEFLEGFGWMSGALTPAIAFVIAAILTIETARWATGGRDFRKSMEKNNEDSIAALLVRNELTVQQIDLAVQAVEQFVRVADAIEAMNPVDLEA